MACITRDTSREELEAVLPGLQRRQIDGIEDYLWIGGERMSASAAAERLGVSDRRICRFRAILRAVQGGGQ